LNVKPSEGPWELHHLTKIETQFKEVFRRSLGNLCNHCLEFYLETRGFFPKEPVQPLSHGINEFTQNRAFVHSSTFSAPSWPAQGIPSGQLSHLRTPTNFVTTHVNDCIIYSFRPTETSSHGNIQFVLAHPRN
jgi:hypothetical protein